MWEVQLVLTSLVFLINNKCGSCFNIENRSPFSKFGDKGTYFGFSVAQHVASDGKKWLLVGSPLGRNLQPGTNRSGALFKCPVSPEQFDCEQVITDGMRDDEIFYEDEHESAALRTLLPPQKDEIKDNQWLGVTVKSQGPSGAAVCAHRYIQSDNIKLHHYGTGLCYYLDGRLNYKQALEPCKGRPMEKLHQQYGFCQVGTSLALLDNGEAIMGSPGPYTWRGTIFIQAVERDNEDFLNMDKTIYHGPLSDDNTTEKYSYLGMSSDGGNFFNRSKITYVSGAPRSMNNGEVFFFEKARNKYEILRIMLRIPGEKFASSFGYTLLVTDIDQDGYDDLLVGSPFYYSDTMSDEGGAVYVYLKLRDCLKDSKCDYTNKLVGKEESRFGFSMTSLGDINKDGFNDVAIGAPYEGDGAIYIYLGSSSGLSSKPSQIIREKNLKTLGYSLSGGIDMDGNNYPDLLVGAYDSDVAILYRTRPIIDIKIQIKGDLKNLNYSRKACPDPFNQNDTYTCFNVQSCYSIKVNVVDPFFIGYHISEVLEKTKISRVWFPDRNFPDKRPYQKTVPNIEVFPRNKFNGCQRETIYIKEGIRDIFSPLEFKVEFTLKNDQVNSPILNKTSVKRFTAMFQKDCGGEDICKSYIVLNLACRAQKDQDVYNLSLGENEEMLLDVNITNSGEAAYESKLFVTHPQYLSYISLQSDKNKSDSIVCTLINRTMVSCNLGNPFHKGRKAGLTFRFEVSKNARPDIRISAFVNSTSKDLSNESSKMLRAHLQKNAAFTLNGISSPSHLVFGGEIKGESAMRTFDDIGAKVKHKYEITNTGKWSLQNVTIVIQWPFQVQSDRPQGKWLLYLESFNTDKGICTVHPEDSINPLHLFSDVNHNITARRKRDTSPSSIPKVEHREIDGKKRKVVTLDCLKKTAKCFYIECQIRNLQKLDHSTIEIISRLWNSTLAEDYNNVDWVSIRSSASVTVSDTTITLNPSTSQNRMAVETIAYPPEVPPEGGVSLWIIIVSVIAGLLLLLVLIFILYKCGFFKRNRVDHTLSGNLKKQGESENLLDKK